VNSGPQSRVAAGIPGAAALGLLAPPTAAVVPASALADPGWTEELLALRARQTGTAARRVQATVWWYSASLVLVTPALAGLVTGRPLSARLADTSMAFLPGGWPVAATSWVPGGDVAAELRDSLAAAVVAVA
jgi:ferric iron reductase protein FhuF